MNIAINTRLLLPDKLDGIGWYTLEISKRLAAAHPEHNFFFLFDRKPDPSLSFPKNVTVRYAGPPARHTMLYPIWFGFTVKRLLKKCKADLFISTDGFLCLGTEVPQIAVMHDLNFEHFPEDLPSGLSKFYQKYFPLYAQKAARIVTVSEFSKKDIEQQYSIQADRIDVVYNGVNTDFQPLRDSEIAEVRQQYAQGDPYFTFVGSIHPRKNLKRLLQAFEQYKTAGGIAKLVVVGREMFNNATLAKQLKSMKHADAVVFAGRLGKKDLNRTIGSALAQIYVPYFEGFGLPILEGWACGIPVVTSSVTSMPEVAGDAALLVDPLSVDQIAAALHSMEKDENLRNELVAKGNERVQNFSWDKSAEGLWASVQKVTSGT